MTTVEMEEIPPELVLNWDQTGIKIVPSNTWTMDQQGSKRVEVVGVMTSGSSLLSFVAPLWGFSTGPSDIPRYHSTLSSPLPISKWLGYHTFKKTLVK